MAHRNLKNLVHAFIKNQSILVEKSANTLVLQF